MTTSEVDFGIEFLEVEDLAKILHVSPSVIYNQIHAKKKGKVGLSPDCYVKVGRRILFVKSKVKEAILSQTLIS